MPAMTALPRLVRSIRDTQYMAPTVVTRRRSMRCMMRFCSAGVNSLSRMLESVWYAALSSIWSTPSFSLLRSMLPP